MAHLWCPAISRSILNHLVCWGYLAKSVGWEQPHTHVGIRARTRYGSRNVKFLTGTETVVHKVTAKCPTVLSCCRCGCSSHKPKDCRFYNALLVRKDTSLPPAELSSNKGQAATLWRNIQIEVAVKLCLWTDACHQQNESQCAVWRVNKAHYRVVNERLALYTGEKLAGATTLKFLTEEKSRVTPRQIFSHV